MPDMNDSKETIGGVEEMELDTSMNLNDSIPKSETSRSLSTAQESNAEQSILCAEEKMDTMEDNDIDFQGNQRRNSKTSQFFVNSQAMDASSMKEPIMNHEQEADEAFDQKSELERTIKALETLRMSIMEVIAFPTLQNYDRLLLHSQSAHECYTNFATKVDLGDIISDSSPKGQHFKLDPQSRSKLNSFGTNYWNVIEKHPELFIDAPAALGQTHESIPVEERKLKRVRGLCSSFVRSLACRLILISRFRTLNCQVPELVMTDSLSGSTSLPVALSSELDFGLKCLSRAGRAMMYFDANEEHVTVAYNMLSLAIVCWEGLKLLDSSKDGNVGDLYREAFEVFLLMPDCAAKISCDTRDERVDEQHIQKEEYRESSKLIVYSLQCLEDFVKSSYEKEGKENKSSELYDKQHFLPSVARICYKHANKLAIQGDYVAAQEALRISLSSADQALEHLIKARQVQASNQHIEIQEEEVVIVSKQSFYLLTQVYCLVKKYDEASQCLERIERYVNQKRLRDDDLYNQTMATLKSKPKSIDRQGNPTSFALEGPQQQDEEAIKSRAEAARTKARLIEANERVALAHRRIDLRQQERNDLSLHDHKYINDQYTKMISHAKRFLADYTGDLKLDVSIPLTPETEDSVGLMVSKILDAARMICSQRFQAKENEVIDYQDPYDSLMAVVLDDNPYQVCIYLEALHTTVIAALSTRDEANEYRQSLLQAGLDQRALGMGKKLSSMLRNVESSSSKSKKNNSTLFAQNVQRSINMKPLFQKARDYCAKALSVYQGRDECHEQTIEWCDILLEVLNLWRQQEFPCDSTDAFDDNCDAPIAGILAIKAHSESALGSYGSGLKTVRKAFEKDSAQLGILVTLFQCSMQYELFSNSECAENTFFNTLLELDNSIATFTSSAKLLEGSESVANEALLEVFPLLCKLSLENDHLLLGLQERMTEISIKVVESKVQKSSSLLFMDIAKTDNIMLPILLSFQAQLDTLQKLSPKFVAKSEEELDIGHYQFLSRVLHKVIGLLVQVRDNQEEGKNKVSDDLDFHDDASFLEKQTEATLNSNNETQSLFDGTFVQNFIGKQSDCLAIAERLWNLSNLLMKLNFPSNQRDILGDLLSGAHDIALLSEEEIGQFLTKGYLAYDSFHSESFDNEAKAINFTSNISSTDVCSEFSAQALLSAIGNTICAARSGNFTKEKMGMSIRALAVAISELRTLDLLENLEVQMNFCWVALNLMIVTQNDNTFSRIMIDGGLLCRLLELLLRCEEKEEVRQFGTVEQVFAAALQLQKNGMPLSAKALFQVCLQIMSKTSRPFLAHEENTIGAIQRKIITLSTSVDDVISTFDEIDCIFRKDKDFLAKSFSKSDIDFFVVEAHNRACRLAFIGDVTNATRLFGVAMNLFPSASLQVSSYGSTIRQNYRFVIGRKGIGAGSLSSF